MASSLADIRKEYTREAFSEQDADADPFRQFERWMNAALRAEIPEPTAVTLATAAAGRPTARVVLLKGFDARGFVFYTNYESRKGRELAAAPLACLNFFWPELERQVRVEGRVARVSADESDGYFASRPRGSQLGAWVSPQSQPIPHRDVLSERADEIAEKYADTPVTRPEHWGGFRLQPDYFEFWQGRPSRLHDRIAYQLSSNAWDKQRLAP